MSSSEKSPEKENSMETHVTPRASQEILKQVFPEKLPTPEELEEKYPPRELPEGAMVTRVGPSPTGFMHIGTLYTALLSERFAHQTDGVFYLRIEDTDKKREVEGAIDFISKSFKHFKIPFDEGRDISGAEEGKYGPYTQSDRKDIYHSYVKHLLEQGEAYLCFCTPEDLEHIRDEQKANAERPGYYGKWAKWRDKSSEEVSEMLNAGQPYVVRYKSKGDYEKKMEVDDLILGERELPENDHDIVIMKSDKLPTYHLAHVVDDHLMRTTHVIRGDEWLSSLPTHLQLFKSMGWQAPSYAHIAPINKVEGSSKRKLSKRKDPEANVGYFDEQGYPAGALIEYLLNLANSSFEDWRKANPQSDYQEFNLTFERLQNSSGPLFDFKKLGDISRDIIARMSSEELYKQATAWAEKYDKSLAELFKASPDYAKKILSIERDGPKVRKDIGKWSDVRGEVAHFFDEQFTLTIQEATEKLGNISADVAKEVVKEFVGTYHPEDSKDEWFAKIKQIAGKHGFAQNTSEFKKNPSAFKGNVADVAKIFRVLLTGKTQTPDLHAIMQIMGKERVLKRLALI